MTLAAQLSVAAMACMRDRLGIAGADVWRFLIGKTSGRPGVMTPANGRQWVFLEARGMKKPWKY